MNIFGSILNKIFNLGRGEPNKAATGPASQPGQPPVQTAQTAASAPAAAASAPKLQSVDVEAVLTELAAKKGGGGNWRTSIVDLLKLLDLDSSLAARKDLAKELNVRAGADGSAEQNIALQKAVMAKLAENGGKVPASLRD